MARRFWASLRRDSLVTFRAQFYTIQLAVAVIYIVAVSVLLPANTTLKPTLYVADESRAGNVAADVREGQFDIPIAGKVRLVRSAADVEAKTKANENSLGVVVQESSDAPAARLYFQGDETPRIRNLLRASVASAIEGGGPRLEAQVLREEKAPVSFRDNLVPFLLLVDFAGVGMIFAATLMFAEKDEGILAAYRVSPGRTWEYLLSKALSVTLVAILVSLVVVGAAIGGGVNYLGLAVLVGLTSLAVTLLGVGMALWFRSFQEFFIPMIIVGQFVISLPAVAYLVPSFRPGWLMAIPTTKFIFGLREAIFPSGNPGDLVWAIAMFAVLSVVLLALSAVSFERQLARA
jgi:fluoroquinolone transport system permease protein